MKDPLPLEQRLRSFLNSIPGTIRYKAELCGASVAWTYAIMRYTRDAPNCASSATTRYRSAMNALEAIRHLPPMSPMEGPNLRWLSPALCAELGVKYRP
jgi:hypothetical protein